MSAQDNWTLESALEIVQHPTVDSRVWSEAVEWLLLNGPPAIRAILQEASGHATFHCFPSLKVERFNESGEPCYSISDIARTLDIPEDEAIRLVAEKEQQHGTKQLFDEQETRKIQ